MSLKECLTWLLYFCQLKHSGGSRDDISATDGKSSLQSEPLKKFSIFEGEVLHHLLFLSPVLCWPQTVETNHRARTSQHFLLSIIQYLKFMLIPLAASKGPSNDSLQERRREWCVCVRSGVWGVMTGISDQISADCFHQVCDLSLPDWLTRWHLQACQVSGLSLHR